jgi:hypothetical protein
LIRDLIEKSYIPDMKGIEVDGIQYDPPLPIPWYPDRLGWQINAPRPVIRRSAPFSKFQKFIMSETEAVNRDTMHTYISLMHILGQSK